MIKFYLQPFFSKKKRKRKKFLFATLACQGGWHFKFILRKNISILNFFYIKKNKHIYLNTRNEFHIVALKIKIKIKIKKHIYLHLFFLTFKPMCQLWSISCEWNLIIGIGFLSGFWVIVRGRVGHLMFIW